MSEAMEREWIMGSPARARIYMDADLQVYLGEGIVKDVRRSWDTWPCYRVLTPQHPLANSLIGPNEIMAWRIRP